MFANARRRTKAGVPPVALRRSAAFVVRSRPFPWFALMPGGYTARYEASSNSAGQPAPYGAPKRGSNYGY